MFKMGHRFQCLIYANYLVIYVQEQAPSKPLMLLWRSLKRLKYIPYHQHHTMHLCSCTRKWCRCAVRGACNFQGVQTTPSIGSSPPLLRDGRNGRLGYQITVRLSCILLLYIVARRPHNGECCSDYYSTYILYGKKYFYYGHLVDSVNQVIFSIQCPPKKENHP